MIFTAMAVSASAALTIRGNYTGPRWQLYLFKPLTMVILIASLLPSAGQFATWQWLIVLGLIFSLAGDVFLMLPSDKFIAGLASFLVAHLCYIGAFYPHYAGGVTWPWFAAVAGLGVGMLVLLRAGLGSLLGPVIGYLLAILTMLWLAGELYWQAAEPRFAWLLAGAAVFALSDASLAWNKFRTSFHWAQALILSTYFFAQWLIVQGALAG